MDIKELMSEVWPEWEITERIGEGSFGVVYKAKRTGLAGVSWSAVKVTSIPRSESELDSLRSEGLSPEQAHTYFENIVRDYSHEIRLMESVKGHSNIVSIEDYSIYEHRDKTAWDILIRMELLTPLTKYMALNEIKEKDIVRLGTDLCRALSVCAGRQIVHRDVKPENIFVSELGSFKLGDFGVARKLDHTTMDFTRTGALNYMAPEIFNDTEQEIGFDDAAKADIYSLGLVMYCLANHSRLPFLPADKKILSLEDRKSAFAERVRGTELPRPCGEISDGLWQVIRKACAFDPERRYASAGEMLEALEAPGGKAAASVPSENEGRNEKKDGEKTGGKGGKKSRIKRLIAFAAVFVLAAVFMYRLITPAPTPGRKTNGAVAEIELDKTERILISGGGFVQYCSFIPPESATYYISVESEDGYPVDAMLFDTGIGSAFLGGINSTEGNKNIIQFFMDAGTERFFYFRFEDETKTGMVRVLIEKRPFQNSGTCGDDLTWNLTDDGILTISGQGSMDDIPNSDIPWYDVRDSVKKLVVEEGVTEIAPYAFSYCSNLADVTLPTSLINILDYAFCGCTSLKELIIPEGVVLIGGSIISGCYSLESVSFPASLRRISDDGFSAQSCGRLREINISPENKYFRVVEGVLFDYDMEVLLCHPMTLFDTEYYIPDTVWKVGPEAFCGCNTLRHVYFPDSVEYIGVGAFSDCENLGSVIMPDSVTYVGGYAFFGCSSLKEVRLSGKLTSLDQQCFSYCGSLESIIFPDGFRTIGNGVFTISSNLRNVYIPASVTDIRSGAFLGCDRLTIYGQADSCAQSFAQENGIPFVEAPHPTMIPYEPMPSPTPPSASGSPS